MARLHWMRGMPWNCAQGAGSKSNFNAKCVLPLASSQLGVSASSGATIPAPVHRRRTALCGSDPKSRTSHKQSDISMSFTEEPFTKMTRIVLAVVMSAAAPFAMANSAAPALSIDATAEQTARQHITQGALEAPIRFLASDALEG